jgi:hypothetical protein
MGPDTVAVPPQTVGAGEGTIQVNITMPEGYKLNDLAPFTASWPDDPVAQIPEDARNFRQILPELPLEVPVTFAEGQTELVADMTIYWCEAINETLCFVDRVQFNVPVTVVAGDETHLIEMDHTLVPPVVEDTLQ